MFIFVIFIFVLQDYRLLLIYHHLQYLNIVDNSSLKTFLFVVIYNNKYTDVLASFHQRSFSVRGAGVDLNALHVVIKASGKIPGLEPPSTATQQQQSICLCTRAPSNTMHTHTRTLANKNEIKLRQRVEHIWTRRTSTDVL